MNDIEIEYIVLKALGYSPIIRDGEVYVGSRVMEPIRDARLTSSYIEAKKLSINYCQVEEQWVVTGYGLDIIATDKNRLRAICFFILEDLQEEFGPVIYSSCAPARELL